MAVDNNNKVTFVVDSDDEAESAIGDEYKLMPVMLTAFKGNKRST